MNVPGCLHTKRRMSASLPSSTEASEEKRRVKSSLRVAKLGKGACTTEGFSGLPLNESETISHVFESTLRLEPDRRSPVLLHLMHRLVVDCSSRLIDRREPDREVFRVVCNHENRNLGGVVLLPSISLSNCSIACSMVSGDARGHSRGWAVHLLRRMPR